MKKLVIVLVFAVVAGSLTVAAEKQVFPAPDLSRLAKVDCALQQVVLDWDFTINDQGFVTTTCDPTMPTATAPMWEHGITTYVPGSMGTVWGTILEGDYTIDLGEGLLSPEFTVDPTTNLMEIKHYVHTETNWDGGNVVVVDVGTGAETPIVPVAAYTGTITVSASYYAWCVEGEDVFTGSSSSGPSENWTQRCFDLSAFDGQTIRVRFDFGNDSFLVYPGWYLEYVKIGNTIPVELQSFDID